MDLNLLKIFIKVADCGSLTKASKLLNHPKSKISRDLVKLEHELEQTLLIRTPRGITLTDQGYALLQSTRSQLESLEISLQDLKSDPQNLKGKVKVTAPEDLSTFVLTKLVSEFMGIYPEVTVELYATTEFLDFQKNQIDLALRIGKLPDSSLVQKKIGDIDVIFVSTQYYAKSNPPIRTKKDLHQHSLALMRDVYGKKLTDEPYADLEARFFSNSTVVLKDYISHDKGVGALPKFLCQREINSNRFVHILKKEVYMKRGLYLLSRQATYTPKHVKIFKDFLYEGIQKEIT